MGCANMRRSDKECGHEWQVTSLQHMLPGRTVFQKILMALRLQHERQLDAIVWLAWCMPYLQYKAATGDQWVIMQIRTSWKEQHIWQQLIYCDFLALHTRTNPIVAEIGEANTGLRVSKCWVLCINHTSCSL